jgi:hypothetical protein
LSDPADEEANRAKAVRVAELIERLAGSRTFDGAGGKEEDGSSGDEVQVKKEA